MGHHGHHGGFVFEVDDAVGWVQEVLEGAGKGAAGVHGGRLGCKWGERLVGWESQWGGGILLIYMVGRESCYVVG